MSQIEAELITRRLAFIRYLYTLAVDQSRKPEPASYVSILTFHDAIELFLSLALIRLGESKKEPDFMAYWDILDAKLRPRQLGQKEPMRRLNNLRGALKHQGQLPATVEIETARAAATAFFDENTPLIFGMAFDSVSLVELVDLPLAREHLKRSQAARAEGDLIRAQKEVACALACLLDNSDVRTRPGVYGSPIGIGKKLSHKHRPYVSNRELQHGLQEVVSAHNEVVDVIEELQETLLVVALGFDYRKFVRYKLLTPTGTWSGFDNSGRVVEYRTKYWDPPTNLSMEDATFCFDFVLENALRLQR